MHYDRRYIEDPHRVLIVRPGALGDTILTLPLLSSLKTLHPQAEFTFLGNRAYKDLIPEATLFQAIDSRAWLWLFTEGTGPHAGAHAPFRTAYVILNRPEDVIVNLRQAGTSSIRAVSSRTALGTHIVEHLHKGLGLSLPPREHYLRHLAPPVKKDLIWVHPGSGGPRKCVPLGLMISVVERFREWTDWDVAVTVGEEDTFLKASSEWKHLIGGVHTELLENRPLSELCATLGSARIFLGNDSGIGHMAAGLGVSSVLFFADTDPVQWSPWVPSQMLHVLDMRGRPKPWSISDSTLISIFDIIG